MLAQFLLFFLSCITVAFIGAAVDRTETLSGCQQKCGNINIPYPFGIGKNCSIAPWADINCSTTFIPPKPFIGDVEVSEFSLTEVRIKNSIGTTCFDKYGRATNETPAWINLTGTPFTFSSTKNKLTAIGCDTFVLASLNDDSYSSGCLSQCHEKADLREGPCSGIGCCQSSIPKGVKNFLAYAGSIYNHTKISYFDKCSTTFLVEENKYTFKVSDLANTTSLEDIPIVLNFAIPNQTCRTAKQNATAFACKANSNCYNSVDGAGYFCNCSIGYEGNPYLNQGCQDVNECDEHPCDVNAICTNTQGGYNCSCPHDSYGDGRKDGVGCNKKDKKLPVLQLTLGVGFGILILLVGGPCLYHDIQNRKNIKLKEMFFKKNGGLLLKQQASRESGVEPTKIFTTEELKLATNNYDRNRIIGQGGSGTVYKGSLPDLTIVAIKKSKVIDESQLGQFINEVVILTQVNHRNVVKLIGCCLETEVPLLVYEFVSNGPLYHHLHKRVGNFYCITWKDRLRIAAEAAGALAYLHSAATIPIIHRDVKSANILLDENYTAKVADFGASRLNPMDQTQISTLVQGTMGYLDPEYFHTSQLTEKSDVHSFGVVLAELLTGAIPISFGRSEHQRNLATYFVQSLKEGLLFEILEAVILNEAKTEQVLAVAKLAKRCLCQLGDERPSMKEVAAELDGLRGFQKHGWVKESSKEKMSSAKEEVDLYGSPAASLYSTSSASFIAQGSSGLYSGEKEVGWPMLNAAR